MNLENITEAITSGVKVQVASKYIPEHSNCDIPKYFFAYWVTIINNSKQQIKILNRHWEIIDANGKTEIIDGEGVIGKKPIIDVKSSFSYNSFCPINTEFGIMSGYYHVKCSDGHFMKVKIPAFKLITPFSIN